MNPVNRQYFVMANLSGHTDMGRHTVLFSGLRECFFKESQPEFIRHPVILGSMSDYLISNSPGSSVNIFIRWLI
jgi:hypothetical protein